MSRRAAAARSGAVRLPDVPLLAEARLARALRPETDAWSAVAVAPRGATLLGISFRPLQCAALGLDADETLATLLALPFDLVRLGAYWDRLEPTPGALRFDTLDRQLAAVERAGKHVLLNVGAVKTFGYPEFFVPEHHLTPPLREGARVTPTTHPALLAAATALVTRIVERYRERQSIVGWQVEHESTDPLGVEHSWRLATDFVRAEVAAVRAADPSRSVMLNGFLPTSALVHLQQWWRTRDQGDSLALAQQLADVVGVDYYPRHALASMGPWTLYLNGSGSDLPGRRLGALCAWTGAHGQRLMIAEGQAEPWEATTRPPNPAGQAPYSCLPEHVIANYNWCMNQARSAAGGLYAYLFWGAEYWVLRERSGDPRYLSAVKRVLAEA